VAKRPYCSSEEDEGEVYILDEDDVERMIFNPEA